MVENVVIGGEVSLSYVISGDCSLSTMIDGQAGTFMPLIADAYTGETVVTPNEETQTLYTNGKNMPSNVIVNPIPSNYGRIAWNGSTITVY